MLRSPEEKNMSLHENRPMERSQAMKAAATGSPSDQQHVHRLYPSLPKADTYEACVPDHSRSENPPTAAARHPENLPRHTQLYSPQSEVSAINMKAQILVMEKQRQELLSINEKWSKEYRTMVRYYQEKMHGLKALLQHSDFCSKEAEKGEKHVTLCERLTVMTVKDKVSSQDGRCDVSSEVEREAEELRAQNMALTRRGQHQHEEIRRLNKALAETLHTTQPVDVSSETLQELWKQQAEIYKEDFSKERRDREKLKGKYLELEKRLRKAQNELQLLKSQVTRTRPPQPVSQCACKHATEQHPPRPHRQDPRDEKR